MSHILLLGSNGLLGANIHFEVLKSSEIQITTSARDNTGDYKFNYTIRGLNKLIRQVKPDVVINCIAATSPSTSLRASVSVNSVLPIQLALLSRRLGFQTIHFSTNAVFSGNNRRNTERTFSIPRTKYGFTKLLGDLSAFRNLVIRTSFIGIPPIGPGLNGIVLKCKSAKQNDVLNVRDNYLWNGLTIDALTQLILVIIREAKIPFGIFHIGASSPISREELIKMILVRIGRNDVHVHVDDKKSQRNMSLETLKSPTVSSWWSRTRFESVPDLTSLLREANFN